MTQNLSYDIEENSTPGESVNIDQLIAEINEEHDLVKDSTPRCSMPDDDFFALEIDYGTNYTVKGLSQILDYYGIPRRKLRKDEMVQILVLFESDTENIEAVERRKRMWSYVEELREDPYFAKYVIFST